jgi:hypothetical protein
MVDRSKFVCLTGACAVGALIAAPRADAQQPPAGAPQPDPTSIWTIQDENASISTASLTDRYYVNGLRVGWTSGTDLTPDFLNQAGRVLWGDGQTRISFDISQEIYTPADTQVLNPPPNDRPYAGVLLGNFGLVTDTTNARSTIAVSLGVVGPWALAEQVQNGFHDIIGQDHANGWHFQIHNQFAFEAVSARTWRIPLTNFRGLDVDALPELDAGIGDLRIYAEAGGVVRIGQGLDSDFGVARVRPGMSGGDAFKPTRPLVWYVFAGGDGRAVAYDITLNGNPFQNSRSVSLTPLIGEVEFGVALMAFGTRLTYTQVLQTKEFQHQKSGLHQFGSFALSVRF